MIYRTNQPIGKRATSSDNGGQVCRASVPIVANRYTHILEHKTAPFIRVIKIVSIQIIAQSIGGNVGQMCTDLSACVSEKPSEEGSVRKR